MATPETRVETQETTVEDSSAPSGQAYVPETQEATPKHSSAHSEQAYDPETRETTPKGSSAPSEQVPIQELPGTSQLDVTHVELKSNVGLLDEFFFSTPTAVQGANSMVTGAHVNIGEGSTLRENNHSKGANYSSQKENENSVYQSIESESSDLDEIFVTSPKFVSDSNNRRRSIGSARASYEMLITESSPKMSPISKSPTTSCSAVTAVGEGLKVESPCNAFLNKTFKEWSPLSSPDFSDNSRNSLTRMMDYIKNPPSPIVPKDTPIPNEVMDHQTLMSGPCQIAPDYDVEKKVTQNPLSIKNELLNELVRVTLKKDIEEQRDDQKVKEIEEKQLLSRKLYYYYETPKLPKSDVAIPVSSLYFEGEGAELPDVENVQPNKPEQKPTLKCSSDTRSVLKDQNAGMQSTQKPVSTVVSHLKSRVEPLASKPAFVKQWAETGTIPKTKLNTKITAVHPTTRPTTRPTKTSDTLFKTTTKPTSSTVASVRPQSTISRNNYTSDDKAGVYSAISSTTKAKYDLTKSVYAQKTVSKSKDGVELTKPTKYGSGSTKLVVGKSTTAVQPTVGVTNVKRATSATRNQPKNAVPNTGTVSSRNASKSRN